MKVSRRQRGFVTPKNTLLVLLLVFFIPFAIKVGNAYFNNTFVEAALVSASQLDPPLGEMTKKQIKSKIRSVFNLNNVRGAPAESIEVVRVKRDMFVNVNYEVREPLFFNIDLVMKFDNQLDLSDPEACCKPKVDTAKVSKSN